MPTYLVIAYCVFVAGPLALALSIRLRSKRVARQIERLRGES